jgi:hypothetical protein
MKAVRFHSSPDGILNVLDAAREWASSWGVWTTAEALLEDDHFPDESSWWQGIREVRV